MTDAEKLRELKRIRQKLFDLEHALTGAQDAVDGMLDAIEGDLKPAEEGPPPLGIHVRDGIGAKDGIP